MEAAQLRRATVRIALVAACLAASLGFATKAQAAQPALVTDLTWGISSSDQDRSIAALRDSHARWARLSIQWKAWEPQQGKLASWEVARTDRAIQVTRQSKVHVLLDVVNAPAWASSTDTDGQGNVPRDPAAFAQFMRMVASRYRGQVDAYEIWNEPDIARFWNGGPNAAQYTNLLKAGYTAVKQADPSALVVGGALSWDYDKYLSAMYRAGAKGYFDVLSIHPYSTKGLLSSWVSSIRLAHHTQLANRDTRPIWITEFGFNTSSDPNAWQRGVTEAQQAQLLTDSYRALEGEPYVQVAFYYSLRNNWWSHDDPRSMEACFGLLRTDFSAKPAFSAFRAYALSPRALASADDASAIAVAPAPAAGALAGSIAAVARVRNARLIRFG
jgi:polysaccharide biosynthesis protein PslG